MVCVPRVQAAEDTIIAFQDFGSCSFLQLQRLVFRQAHRESRPLVV